MADIGRTGLFGEGMNFLIIFFFLFSTIGIGWLALNKVEAGIVYTTILLIAIAFISVSFWWLGDDNRAIIKRTIKSPFTTDLDIAAFMYLLGASLPLMLRLFFKIFRVPFEIATLQIPLAAAQINQEVLQSLQIAQIQNSAFFQFFITVFVAGSNEEFVFGYVLFIVGLIAGIGLLKFLNNGEETFVSNNFFYIAFALVFTGGLFAGAHILNGTYITTGMFVTAILFRVSMNYLIYVIGIVLSFTMGFHQMNNAIYFAVTNGSQVLANALLSPGGVIVLIFILLIVWYVFIVRGISNVASKTWNYLVESFGY